MDLLKLFKARDHIKKDRESLMFGDHIYRYGLGKIYTHHGIYTGNEMVIHYTRTEEGGKEPSQSGTCRVCHYRSDFDHRGVVKTCLNCFLAGQNQIYWYQYGVSAAVACSFPVGSYSTRRSRPPPEVVACASRLLGHGFNDYNLFLNNCEDFARFCKTGYPESSQIDYVTNSLSSITRYIIDRASENGYFGLAGGKVVVLVPLLFLLVFLFLFLLLEYLCSSGLKHLSLIFRWIKQLCFLWLKIFVFLFIIFMFVIPIIVTLI